MTLRPDLAVIAGRIAPGSRVLDVGCGDGALLAELRAEANRLATELAEKKVRELITPDDQARIVAAAIEAREPMTASWMTRLPAVLAVISSPARIGTTTRGTRRRAMIM